MHDMCMCDVCNPSSTRVSAAAVGREQQQQQQQQQRSNAHSAALRASCALSKHLAASASDELYKVIDATTLHRYSGDDTPQQNTHCGATT
jgi:hypothetical protein